MTTQLELRYKSWGGRRDGAGRKVKPGRRSTPHRARPAHYHGHPVHVTFRAKRGVPNLRAERPFRQLRAAIARASRGDFRVVHFSIQTDHVHLLVEAHDRHALSRGARGLAIRLARQLNRAVGRTGGLWGDRWNGRALKSPREVRTAIVYVLANCKKHLGAFADVVDPCSSAAWFGGFADVPVERLAALRRAAGVGPPVCEARTWLGSVAWRRHGLVRGRERPA